MKITKIKILKNKVNISFDNANKLSIDKEVFTNFYLYEGKELSKEEYKSILELNDTNKLLQYALKLRSKSIYSEYKLREKLYSKEASKRSVDKVIKILKGYDLIDDKAYASDLVEYYNSLNYGENKIKTKLAEKGIFKEIVDKMKFPISIEKKKANNLLPKLEKKYDKYNASSRKSHIYNAYILEGYSKDLASEMMSKIKSPNQKDELDKLKKDYLKTKSRLERKYKGKELKQKILSSLLTKGYKMNDILKVL
jgi:1,2-diacylglycerol 3-alpha-glucosyltransferase